ncbi:MAG: ANTAR domain-containing protein [Pseudonocardiaceae bacterium]
MLAQRGRVDMTEAFTRLRRHAREHNLKLSDLARQVATGALDRTSCSGPGHAASATPQDPGSAKGIFPAGRWPIELRKRADDRGKLPVDPAAGRPLCHPAWTTVRCGIGAAGNLVGGGRGCPEKRGTPRKRSVTSCVTGCAATGAPSARSPPR